MYKNKQQPTNDDATGEWLVKALSANPGPGPRPRHHRFTLVEVLIAFGCTGIVLAAAMSLSSLLIYSDEMVTRRNAALSVAQSQIDYLRTVSYSILTEAAETATRVNASGMGDASGGYTRTTTVTAAADGSPCSDILVTVTVLPIGSRPGHSISLPTVIVDKSQVPGMQ